MRRIDIRRAVEEDVEGALRLMGQLDLIHSAVAMRNLWVVMEEADVVGVAHLEHAGESLFLSSVGVRDSHRHMGLGRRLVEAMLKDAESDVYLYTVIPEFFDKLGFVETQPPAHIPPRDVFGCENCELGKCRCMVSRRG